ncbi:MAG: helix-turn-helix domain-containing protein [Planctomycetaceae bacterium]|nr:helix-turn-helix domain-containing protein [Planctomycetaceae bacterium]MCB9951829.1 helix-turn-helix domain-containing protein [Planctomycetaceae bacterium]
MYLSVREVARTLHCSQGCIYRLVANGDLRNSRIGIGRGTIRIHERDLEEYLERRSSHPRTVPAPRQNLREFLQIRDKSRNAKR